MTKVLTSTILEQLGNDAENFDTSEFTEIADEVFKKLVNLRLRSDVSHRNHSGPTQPQYNTSTGSGGEDRRVLDLDGLTHLTESAAEHLGNFDGAIYLNGLTGISDTALRSLCKSASELSLNGLTTISESTARQLHEFRGFNLFLDGIKHLHRNTAEILFTLKPYRNSLELSLNGLTSLQDDVAHELRQFQGNALALDGLTGLSPVGAESISMISPTGGHLDVSLNGLSSISDEAADYLSKVTGDLSLNGLATISFSVAESLGKFQGLNLWLDGLQDLSPGAAANLSGIEGADLFASRVFLGLFLNGLKHLSEETAANLSRINSGLWLNGLEEMSDEVAEHLSQTTEELWLAGIKNLSDNAAASLSKKPQELHLDGLEELSTSAAQSFSAFEGVLYLNGLRRITPPALEALCNTKADLALDGLVHLSAEDAESLSHHQGNWLSLNGVTRLSAEAADHLSLHQGEILSLYGVNNISFMAAATMLRYRGNVLVMNLSNVPEDTASILLKHLGILDLAN